MAFTIHFYEFKSEWKNTCDVTNHPLSKRASFSCPLWELKINVFVLRKFSFFSHWDFWQDPENNRMVKSDQYNFNNSSKTDWKQIYCNIFVCSGIVHKWRHGYLRSLYNPIKPILHILLRLLKLFWSK